MTRILLAALLFVGLATIYTTPEDEEPPTTCAECVTDSECEALCEVGPCEKPGDVGCWEPERE